MKTVCNNLIPYGITLFLLGLMFSGSAQNKPVKKKNIDTPYLIGVNGEKYKLSILPLDKKLWNTIVPAPELLKIGDRLVNENTMLSDIKVTESKNYICALPLYPGQQFLPHYTYTTNISFSVKGLINSKQKMLFFKGKQWIPLAGSLRSPRELWLQIRWVSDQPGDSKQDFDYIKIILPFD